MLFSEAVANKMTNSNMWGPVCGVVGIDAVV